MKEKVRKGHDNSVKKDRRSRRRIRGLFRPLVEVFRANKHQRRLNQQLLTGAQLGDLEKVKDALDKGADVDSKDIFGRTPLSLAESSGNEEILNLLRSKKFVLPPLTKKEVDSLLRERGLM